MRRPRRASKVELLDVSVGHLTGGIPWLSVCVDTPHQPRHPPSRGKGQAWRCASGSPQPRDVSLLLQSTTLPDQATCFERVRLGSYQEPLAAGCSSCRRPCKPQPTLMRACKGRGCVCSPYAVSGAYSAVHTARTHPSAAAARHLEDKSSFSARVLASPLSIAARFSSARSALLPGSCPTWSLLGPPCAGSCPP
jgi:hypothetical protein